MTVVYAALELPRPKTSPLEMGWLGFCSSLISAACDSVCFTLESKVVVSAWVARKAHLTHSAAEIAIILCL